MFNVYIIKSEHLNKIYIGHTDRLQERLIEHISGFSKATKISKDWKLIYTEEFQSRSLAMKREKFLKSGDGRKVLRLKEVI